MPFSSKDLSLVIIAKDEADRIENVIRSVPFAKEVIVLDCGSTDGTCAVAQRVGARVVRTDWPGFIAQKNRALDLAKGRLVLSLDADEWLTASAQRDVLRVLVEDPPYTGWSFPRCSRWQGAEIRHGRWYPDRRVRLVRRGAARWTGQEPVDRLSCAGAVGLLWGDIGHDPYRTFSEHLSTIDRYTRQQAATMRANGEGVRAWDPLLHASWHFADSLLLRQGFRDGWRGVALASLGAAHAGLKWHRGRRC